MTSEEFINALQEQDILSERLVEKLREKVVSSGGKLPAKSLAKFLVQKKHISQHVALTLLNEPLEDEVSALADDDNAEAKEAGKSGSGLTPLEDLEDLSAQKQTESGAHELMDDPLVTDVALSTASGMMRKPSAKTEARVRKKLKEAEKKQKGKPKQKKKPVKRKNEWDSPLFLFGGGGLILLVLCGLAVWYMLFRDTGDDLLSTARDAMNQGSYTNAISQYESFLERFPGHPEESPASVELGMAKLRKATEGRSDFRLALKVADEEIKKLQHEPSFEIAHDELATLLPRIARGLSDKANAERDPKAAQELVERATTALEMVANPKFVPKNLRDNSEVQNIRATLNRVGRRQESYQQLQTVLTAMRAAIDAGDTRSAYEAHRKHVREHPEQADDPELKNLVAETSAAELGEIKFVREEQPPLTDEPSSPVLASLSLANHRGGPEAKADGTVCVHIQGALYGLNAATGRLRWRRFTGFDPEPFVVAIGDDVLVRHAGRNELQRVDSETGDVRWRQSAGGKFATPLVLGGKAYVAAESGRLSIVELSSGTIAGHVQFAQPLRVGPAADSSGEVLYVVGEHSSLYTISLSDLSCLGVYYLGHSPGSVRVSPVAVLNKLAVAENNGVENSLFHLLSLDDNGAVASGVTEQRLTGLVVTPPLLAGRRLVVLTDRGEINAYEIGPQADKTSLTAVATRAASSTNSVTGYALMSDGNIWVADEQLTRYSVQPTDNRLPVRDIAENYRGATFDHPLQQKANVLFHVRQPAEQSGVSVAAMDMRRGKVLWQTDLAVSPAGGPIVTSETNTITVANANGDVFSLDRDAIRKRIQDKPAKVRNRPRQRVELTSVVDLGEGNAAFSGAQGSPWVMLYSGDEAQSARWVKLPSNLATPPARLGNGCLAATEIGQVFYLDPTADDPIAATFQPRLQPRKVVSWLPIGTSAELKDQCILADGREMIYLLRLSDNGEPEIEAVTEKQISGLPLATTIAVLNGKAFAGTNDGRVAVFSVPSFELDQEIRVGEKIAMGPLASAGQLVLVSASNELMSFSPNGESNWKLSLGDQMLAGTPLSQQQYLVVAYRSGKLAKIDTASGEVVGEVDLGQPLASGPVELQGRLLVGAHDGTLLVVDML